VGEKPPFNPDNVVTAPENGVILGKGVSFDPTKQAIGVPATAGPDGSLAVSFAGGKEQTLTIKPAMGVWNLNQANQIRVKFKNVGETPATPSVVVGPNTVTAKEPVALGAETEITVPFIPAASTVCASDYTKKLMPGTGTTFESNAAKQFSIVSDSTPGAKSLLITSIVADAAVDDLPDWLGKRPPVDGDWIQTFDEEFDGPSIDDSKWNIYARNYWDKRTHFSKDNLILKDGKAIFHYEKKPGYQNDDPNDKETVTKTDYACGFLNTYGKFTQRYGYFESRMKLPNAPGLWPAFWLMPDRGRNSGTHYRVGTGKQPDTDKGVGGMEFDIMEFLSAWGPYRYNIAMIWDGYGKGMKATGSTHNYVRADKDGYITSGLLWTPGSAIYYCNGREILRWENPRVSDLQEYIMYDMVSGGWEHAQLDDSKLPDDFYIDYCRVWQRKDLATPEDGPKPNKGDPRETKN
jgi:beta-glucanase (GH16 family)